MIAAVVLVPSVTGHWNVAHRAGKPYADAYGSTILNSVPRNSAVFILGAELTDPVIYRQVVYHQRRDVVVIAADGLAYGWYRDELAVVSVSRCRRRRATRGSTRRELCRH